MEEIKRDVEFLVFEDKGVVVCKLHNCKYIAEKRIWKYFKITVMDRYIIDDVFVGVAHCAPEDKFNLEYGKKLALTRAKAKRGRAINKAVENFINNTHLRLLRLAAEGIHKVPDEKEVDEVRKD